MPIQREPRYRTHLGWGLFANLTRGEIMALELQRGLVRVFGRAA